MLCSSGETGFRALARANLEIACLRLVWQRHCRKLWRGWAIHCSCWRHPRGHEPRAESSAGKRRADKGLDLFTFHFSAEEVSVREPARGRRRSLQKSLTLMCLLPRLLQENPERSWDSELSLLLAVPLPALFFGAAPGHTWAIDETVVRGRVSRAHAEICLGVSRVRGRRHGWWSENSWQLRYITVMEWFGPCEAGARRARGPAGRHVAAKPYGGRGPS